MDSSLKQDNRLLKKGYFRTLFPIMFSVLGATINAVIDGILVSQKLGRSALAAVNLSMPVYFVLCTLGALIAGGASVCSARKAGQDNMKSAQTYFQDALLVSTAVSAVVTAVGIVFCHSIAGFLSGSDLADHVYEYCLITFIGTAPIIMAYIPLNYLQLEGKNHSISISVILMVATDIILDLLFIYVLELGLYGASAASVISALVSCVYGFIALQVGDTNYHIGFTKPKGKRISEALKYGSPLALSNLFDAVKLFAVNTVIIAALGESGAVVWAVINTLSELSLMIVTGVSRAGAPMISTYHTAKENSRIRILTALEVQTGLVLSAVFAVVTALLDDQIGMIFSVYEDLLFPVICLGISVLISTICCIWERHFNSIGLIVCANLSSFARNCMFPIAAVVLLAVIGAPIWLFLPVSAAASALFIAIMTLIEYLNKKKSNYPLSCVLLLDDHLERENKVLDFSISADMAEACDASDKIKDFCAANNMDTKATMKLGLAIEELLNVIILKTPEIKSLDLRAFALEGNTGIRIQCAGKNYDPFKDNDADDDFLMGINMIKKMADATTHIHTLGMNIITIIFPDKKG
ncbi:MAG: hypothetical protein IJU82_02850 [Ruminiclostridium sp.]|nr:hypothetical protein [Ruminiclostridium sp.]